MANKNPFSDEVTDFHARELPEKGRLVGYAYIIAFLEQNQIRVPLPDKLAIVTQKHRRYQTSQWEVFTVRHSPPDDLLGQLTFALKYEGIDLYILKKLFEVSGPASIVQMVSKEPTSQYGRRIWFLYEWLMNEILDLPDLKTGSYVDVVNPDLQYTGPTQNSTRHRVRDNLPGTPEFCPMIYKTSRLEDFRSRNLPDQISDLLQGRSKDLIRRAAAFILLKDSKASFEIEQEFPPDVRARNWGKIIGMAGKKPLSIEEIERLQHIVIGTKKLSHMGIRNHEGFIGEHDRETFAPLPDHISAKFKDLPSLMNGWLETLEKLQESDLDPVLAAATLAFGFVFIHPLSDGNGRIHRYIIHHVLSRMGYIRRDLIFPVSAAILDRISAYEEVLSHYSEPRLELIEWENSDSYNVEILNDTIDLYRYYDLTPQAEFLYECVEETIRSIIPDELDYLEKYDELLREINTRVSLPNSKADLLIKMLHQNKGVLAKRKRKLFAELADDEIGSIELLYKEIFQ